MGSKDFSMTNPGILFPHSWTAAFAIAHSSEALAGCPEGYLISCPEYRAQGEKIMENLRVSPPVFDKITEEGLRFRIYRLGSLEVRTTQDPKGEEEIGCIFAIRNP